MSDGVNNSQTVLDRAKITGERVVFPEPNQLQLDIDSIEDHVKMQFQLMILEEQMTCDVVSDIPSKTEGHRHVTIWLGREVTPLERLLLQACLGSDRKRELLGFVNILKGDERPTLFVYPPETTP